MAIKKKAHERLDDDNLEIVIGLLEQEKPIKIKEACERLNIAVNGPRLQKIIQDYKDRKETDRKLRAANRGKPATEYEISRVVEEYLSGSSMKSIGEDLYRSTDFVKRIVDQVGVPQLLAGEDYTNYGPLPEQCVADSFAVGQYVWSSKYGGIAEIDKDMGQTVEGSPVYRIYVHQQIDEEKSLCDGKRFAHHVSTGGGFYAHQPAFELGSLEHLRKYNVDVKRAIK